MKMQVFMAVILAALAFSVPALAGKCDGPSGKVTIYAKSTFGKVPFRYRGNLGGNLQYMGAAYSKAYWYYIPNLDKKTGAGTITVKITNDEKPGRRKTLGVFTQFLDAEGKPVTCIDAKAGFGDRYERPVTYKASDKWKEVKTVLMRPYTYDDGSVNDHGSTCFDFFHIAWHCSD